MAKASLALFICRVACGIPVLGPPWYACWARRGASCAMLDTVMNGATRATARIYFIVMVFLRRLIEGARYALSLRSSERDAGRLQVTRIFLDDRQAAVMATSAGASAQAASRRR